MFFLELCLFYSEKQHVSCLYLVITHDIANIKSGNIFIAQLIAHYGCVSQIFSHSIACTSSFSIKKYKHIPLTDIKPKWFNSFSIIRRKFLSTMMIIYRMFVLDRTHVFPIKSMSYFNNTIASDIMDNDFIHYTISKQLQSDIYSAAKTCEVTINTIFSSALVLYIQRMQLSRKSSANFTIATSLRHIDNVDLSDSFRSYMIDCKVKVPPHSDNIKLLLAVDEVIKYIRDNKMELEMGRMENAILLFNNLIPQSLRYWIMRRTQGTNIFFSNPGVVEENFTCFGSADIPIIGSANFGCLIPPYDLMFVTSTINNVMQIDFMFNEHCFGNAEESFLAPYMNCLDEILHSVFLYSN